MVTNSVENKDDKLHVTKLSNNGFASEYAVSGWFKAASPVPLGWMSVFRLAAYNP